MAPVSTFKARTVVSVSCCHHSAPSPAFYLLARILGSTGVPLYNPESPLSCQVFSTIMVWLCLFQNPSVEIVVMLDSVMLDKWFMDGLVPWERARGNQCKPFWLLHPSPTLVLLGSRARSPTPNRIKKYFQYFTPCSQESTLYPRFLVQEPTEDIL